MSNLLGLIYQVQCGPNPIENSILQDVHWKHLRSADVYRRHSHYQICPSVRLEKSDGNQRRSGREMPKQISDWHQLVPGPALPP